MRIFTRFTEKESLIDQAPFSKPAALTRDRVYAYGSCYGSNIIRGKLLPWASRCSSSSFDAPASESGDFLALPRSGLNPDSIAGENGLISKFSPTLEF